MILVLARIEHDLHGNALHHLHVIAGGVFRRQQAEARAAGAGDAIHVPFDIRGEGVHGDGHALARPHVFELRFLEIRR